MPKPLMRDIVVLLPGIMGSALQKDGKDVWALSGRAVWGALSSLGRTLRQLALTEDDPEADELGDGIRASAPLPDATFIPGFWKIDGYSGLERLVTETFEILRGDPNSPGPEQATSDTPPPANFFPFPYDWRRDNRVAARRLKRLIDERLPQWRHHTGFRDAKAILIGHSMGGLVARYYAEVLEGWRNCKALITFGTPFRGSVNALDFLANGYKKLFLDLSQLLRSFTSVHQLLPIYPMVRAGGEYRRVAETDGLPDVVDRARAEQALAFHREIEDAVQRHRKDHQYRDEFKTIPVVGTHQSTLQAAELSGGRLVATRTLPAWDWLDPGQRAALDGGDGTVPRLSATPIELSDEYRETFLAERHASLQNNPHILGDLRERLKQMQATHLKHIRGPEPATEPPAIRLNLDDLYLAGEPVELHVRLLVPAPGTGDLQVCSEAGGIGGAPVARLEPVSEGGLPAEYALRPRGDSWGLTLEGLAPGLYRCAVRAGAAGHPAPSPVHDLFEVAG
jgi:pimeloyl-ACP methyl ester carboxylesterase